MKDNPNHGNRLRPPAEAYEIKKIRSRERYASLQLKNNKYWLHNKILRDLVNLYGLNAEIPFEEYIYRGFDFNVFITKKKTNGRTVLIYDQYGTYILSNKNLCICEIMN